MLGSVLAQLVRSETSKNGLAPYFKSPPARSGSNLDPALGDTISRALGARYLLLLFTFHLKASWLRELVDKKQAKTGFSAQHLDIICLTDY